MTKKILLLFAILPSILFAQHSIKGNFSPAKDFKFAILYRVTPSTSIYVANAEISEKGAFEFKLDASAVSGSYRIVYALPQEDFNFDLIYNAKEDVELNFDLEKGLTFTASEENKLFASYNRSIAMVNSSIRNYYSKQVKDEAGYAKIFDILKRTQTEFEEAAKDYLALEFIKACKPYIPTAHEDVTTFSKNVKANYFKNIDFGNAVLQNSNFLIKNSVSYVFGFIDRQNPNQSYANNIDTVVKAIGDNPVIKKVVLEILWNQFVGDENEITANYITTTYLLEIAKMTNDRELIDDLTAFKNVSLGNIAPDFEVELKDKDNTVLIKNLSDLKASEKYLIFFWSTTCSHCLEEIPQLKSLVESVEDNQLKVIAIALDNDIYRWKELTYEYPDFIHVYGEGKWDNEIGNNYNVTGTPTYFVLDKDKKIISKPYDIVAFKTYFENQIANENKEVEATEKQD